MRESQKWRPKRIGRHYPGFPTGKRGFSMDAFSPQAIGSKSA